ncbi:MAG TPA: hypothetical protein VG710_12345, partial [Opitutus sp.]|nr:hypothetical protein [Opitutus sp.]
MIGFPFQTSRPSRPPNVPAAERSGAGKAGGEFDSTLVNAVDLRIPGLHLRSFALHRPAAGRAVIEPHPRCWSKAVLFLEGGDASGTQPEAGTVMILPPGATPRSETAAERLPLCVVFDFRLAERLPRIATTCALPRAEL